MDGRKKSRERKEREWQRVGEFILDKEKGKALKRKGRPYLSVCILWVNTFDFSADEYTAVSNEGVKHDRHHLMDSQVQVLRCSDNLPFARDCYGLLSWTRSEIARKPFWKTTASSVHFEGSMKTMRLDCYFYRSHYSIKRQKLKRYWIRSAQWNPRFLPHTYYFLGNGSRIGDDRSP